MKCGESDEVERVVHGGKEGGKGDASTGRITSVAKK